MSFPVQLAVYDLSRGMAIAMSQSLLGQRIDGIWHTGIVVFGKEYYFGGGIQVAPWGQFAQMNGLPASQVLDMGNTTKTQVEFETYLRSISSQYTHMTYNLITNNCNNFADAICKFLTGHGIPSHIVDLPRIVFSTPGGAMLRPMIESMQNNIRQQYGTGLDPFANAQSSSSAPSQNQIFNNPVGQQFESALSQSVTALAMNAIQNVADTSSVPAAGAGRKTLKLAQLDEQPLISADGSTVANLIKKILAISSLTEVEKKAISSISERLQLVANGQIDKKGLFVIEDYLLMEKLIAFHPESHMSALFVLRLMFLHDHATDFSRLNIIRELVRRLLSHRSDGSSNLEEASGNNGASVPSTHKGFATVPAHVMALCAISNLLSHDSGTTYLLGGNSSIAVNGSANSSDLLNDLVDVILTGFGHARAEVRQMASALAYNLALACTKDGKPAGPWEVESESSEMNPHAMQLLCACLENLHEEKDAVVRKRKLATSCRIARAFNGSFSTLVNDLGFADVLQILHTDQDIKPVISNDEREILNELLYYAGYQSVHH